MMPKENEIRKILEELFFDYHIRGCELADEKSNKFCDDRKKEDIKEIFSQLKSAMMEMIPEEKVISRERIDMIGKEKDIHDSMKIAHKLNMDNGYNACITETKARVEEVFK